MTSEESFVIDIDNEKNSSQPHKGKSISKVEISQNREYLVTYSEDDNSIVGWKFIYTEKGQDGNIIPFIGPKSRINNVGRVLRMCVSKDNILAYIYVNDHDNDVKVSKCN